jgi:hypothetical protein
MELLTIKQLADKLQVTVGSLYNLRTQGMPAEIQKPLRFKFDDVVVWLKNRKSEK